MQFSNDQPDEITDEQALLLLYLSGELDGVERAAFERELQRNPQLAEDLEAMRENDESLRRAFAEVDAPPINGAARRNAAREVSQWQVRRLASLHERPIVSAGTYLRWIYAGVVAACLLGAFIWWGNAPETPRMNRPTPYLADRGMGPVPTEFVDSTDAIAVAERDLADISNMRSIYR